MALVRYNSDLADFGPRSFSGLLDRFFNDSLSNFTKVDRFTPQVDVAETEKAYEIQVAVPGMKKEDFNIDLKDKTITISGERKFENKKEEKNYHSVETQYGQFSRSFYLPEDVEEAKIEASYQDGLLNIHLPKDVKKNEAKVIKIK